MVHIADGGAYYLRLAGRRLEGQVAGLARFEMVTVGVAADRIGYAEVLAGITFRLRDPSTAVERWRRTLALLASPEG
jgi:hypothetical protein